MHNSLLSIKQAIIQDSHVIQINTDNEASFNIGVLLYSADSFWNYNEASYCLCPGR